MHQENGDVRTVYRGYIDTKGVCHEVRRTARQHGYLACGGRVVLLVVGEIPCVTCLWCIAKT